MEFFVAKIIAEMIIYENSCHLETAINLITGINQYTTANSPLNPILH
jgi:hypothetical protein